MEREIKENLDETYALLTSVSGLSFPKPSIIKSNNELMNLITPGAKATYNLPLASFSETDYSIILREDYEDKEDSERLYAMLNVLGYPLISNINKEMLVQNIAYLIGAKSTEEKGRTYHTFSAGVAEYYAMLASERSNNPSLKDLAAQREYSYNCAFNDWIESQNFKDVADNLNSRGHVAPKFLNDQPEHIKMLYVYLKKELWRINHYSYINSLSYLFMSGIDTEKSNTDIADLIMSPPETVWELLCPNLYLEAQETAWKMKDMLNGN
jgi:hypothetical protein